MRQIIILLLIFSSSNIIAQPFLNVHTWLSNKDSTYFIVHDKSRHFYRQLIFDKDFQLYDEFFNANERIGLVANYFLVKKEGSFIKLNFAKKLINWLKENEAENIKWHKDITVQQIIRQLNGMG